MLVVLEQVILLILFAAVGYVLSKTKLVDFRHTKLLSTLLVYVFLPCKVFETFCENFTVNYIKTQYSLILISLVIVLILGLVAVLLARVLTRDAYQRSILIYSLIVPNYGYVGYALADALFGSLALQNVMIFTIPISLYVYTLGYCMLTKQKLSFKRLFNPVILSMVLGMIVGLLQPKLPELVHTFTNKSSACMAPVSMILTGIVISEYSFKDLLSNWRNYFITAMRLLIVPIVICAALMLLKLNEAIIPALMIYAMPCGLNTVIFPRLIGEDCKTGASLAFLSNLLCCLTIPLCVYLFT